VVTWRHRPDGPATVDDQHDRSTALARFNTAVAVGITKGVSTMWAAYLLAAVALVSLPAAIATGDPVVIVAWSSSVFLQLVFLPILAVGQSVIARAADQRAVDTYRDTEAILAELTEVREQLAATRDLIRAEAGDNGDQRSTPDR